MTAPAPSERQILYGLVAAAFHVVDGVLAAVGAGVGALPWWWTGTFAAIWGITLGWGVWNWRRTGRLLTISLVVLGIWLTGSLLAR